MKDEVCWGVGVAVGVLITAFLFLFPFVPVFWLVSKLDD